jgi:hypothetical protein
LREGNKAGGRDVALEQTNSAQMITQVRNLPADQKLAAYVYILEWYGNGVNISVWPNTAKSYLSDSDFPLPLLDESAGVNTVSHLKQLDDFLRLRGIPNA